MSKKAKGIMLLTVVAIFGISTIARAGWGRGYGHWMGRDYGGPGWHHRGGYGNCPAWDAGNLTEEEAAKLEKQHDDFIKVTEKIREKLYEKRTALRKELVQKTPDIKNASKLQKEISKLQSELDQKRLDFEIKIKKSIPGYQYEDRRYGQRRGYGYRGGGYCRR